MLYCMNWKLCIGLLCIGLFYGNSETILENFPTTKNMKGKLEGSRAGARVSWKVPQRKKRNNGAGPSDEM